MVPAVPADPPRSEEVSAPEMAVAEPARKPTRHRRLSIIPVVHEQQRPGDAGEEGTGSSTSQAGLYSGEEHPPEDNGAGADPQTSEHVDVVSSIGYTSKAGFEKTGHKKTNQDAFVVLQVSRLLAAAYRDMLASSASLPPCVREILVVCPGLRTPRISRACKTSTSLVCLMAMDLMATKPRTSSLLRYIVPPASLLLPNCLDGSLNCLAIHRIDTACRALRSETRFRPN